jgi:hypothetical protein
VNRDNEGDDDVSIVGGRSVVTQNRVRNILQHDNRQVQLLSPTPLLLPHLTASALPTLPLRRGRVETLPLPHTHLLSQFNMPIPS